MVQDVNISLNESGIDFRVNTKSMPCLFNVKKDDCESLHNHPSFFRLYAPYGVTNEYRLIYYVW